MLTDVLGKQTKQNTLHFLLIIHGCIIYDMQKYFVLQGHWQSSRVWSEEDSGTSNKERLVEAKKKEQTEMNNTLIK